jgi:hypothetical protein
MVVIEMIKHDSAKPHLALVAVMLISDPRILNFYSAFLKFMIDKIPASSFYDSTVRTMHYLMIRWNVKPEDAQKVGVFGIDKYNLFNYLTVNPDSEPTESAKTNIYRIMNAFFRHLSQTKYESADAETGLRHEVHCVHNLVMVANILLTHFLNTVERPHMR